ncbi:nucleic acid/nucleotide deaminase domain-containing protein [Streptomyces sp. NPDC004111]|uniref:WXG100-like domain-containing protein n=1 Tax=Streptomyces sp. NPDC004111 TaxID=3364690 RepID=UPI00367946F0
MGKNLPDELVEVLDFVGVAWPNIDEDEVRGCAKDYRNLANGLRDVIKEGNHACSHIVAGKSKGQTVAALDRRWGKLTSRDLTAFSKGLDELGDALDDCAALIEGCKIACIAELGATAGAATAGVIGMFFTAGLSGLLSAGAVIACRIALHEAIDYAVSEITSVVTDRIEAKILDKIESVFTDRLAAGEGPAHYAPGSADMAQDLAIEFDEFDRASGGYRTTRDNFQTKKGEHKSGGGKRRSSVKKDSRFHKLAAVMDKAEDAVDKKADETVDMLEKHGGKIDQSKKDHKAKDKEAKKGLDQCKVEKEDGGDSPMYLLNADGTVQRITPDGGLDALSSDDKTRLDGVVKDGKVWVPATDKDKRKWNTPQEHTGKVKSTKVKDPAKDNLVQATQLARIARDDYKGTNYAAGRYVDPATGKESVLVGYSNKAGHSERMIGRPLLQSGKGMGLRKVFTEREPCKKNPECGRWMDHYFKEKNPTFKVEHVADYYDDTGKTTNQEHREYVRDLKKAHGK